MISKEEIVNTLEFKELLDELQEAWNEEQRRRHTFWAEVDENKKAEFILGEIVYHSPIYGRHWMCSTHLLRYLIPYVYDRKLGMVAVEKTMIRLTRNDYDRTADAARRLLLAQRPYFRLPTQAISLSTPGFCG